MKKSIVEAHIIIFLILNHLVPHLINWKSNEKIKSYDIQRQAVYAKEDRFNADPPEERFRAVVLQSRAQTDSFEHEWIKVNARASYQWLWMRLCSLYAGLLGMYLAFKPKTPPYKRF